MSTGSGFAVKVRPMRRAIALACCGLVVLLGALGGPQGLAAPPVGTPTHPLPQSSEALARQSIWSRPESYPLAQRPRTDLYRPSAEWIGRLVLPTPAETADPRAPREDWVWIVVEQAPAEQQGLIGERLRLRWADLPHLKQLVATVTTDIRLGNEARQASQEGNMVPTRLDGRRVGPLQSLAGSRPSDDLTVELEQVRVGEGELRIARPPVQISGRWQGLVTVVGAAKGEGLWRVRHFRAASARFDGEEETIRIPSLPPDRYGRRLIDPQGLAGSPHNAQGWLVQGAPAADGLFTVQAILPYAYLRLSPERVVRGTDPAWAFISHDNWSPALGRRGSLHGTALIPGGTAAPGWKLGERALLMHLFGGIGGQDGEPVSGWTVTGHFSFGEAKVVRDGFTGQPRLAIRYHQVYATNPNGIVAGSQDWSAYAGSLQRGWIGLRPFSDVLVPIGGVVLDAIALQTEIIAARYRSGDGSGVALVTPSTSCVQDSGQALWIAIRQLRLQGAERFMSPLDRERLQELGVAFDRLLKPFGRARGDWAHNASRALAVGTGPTTVIRPGADLFETSQTLKDALLSWRSILPRSAHDQFAAEFLRVGLPLLVVRSNQIPGGDPRLEPIAPTVLFGQLPWVPTLLGRLGDSLFPLDNPAGLPWGLMVGISGVVVVLTRGWRRGLLIVPATVEELVFRGLVLPSPIEGVGPLAMVPWVALSVGLFVAWHGLRWRLQAMPVQRSKARVLVRMSLLGGACALAYVASNSLWPPVLLHWLALVRWRGGARDRQG
jgi:predicted Abi (CAAX) family protease